MKSLKIQWFSRPITNHEIINFHLNIWLFQVIIAMTVVGNTLVVVAVFSYRPLKKVQNYFLVSLAASDLAVAIFVMPLHVVTFLAGQFSFLLCSALFLFSFFALSSLIWYWVPGKRQLTSGCRLSAPLRHLWFRALGPRGSRIFSDNIRDEEETCDCVSTFRAIVLECQRTWEPKFALVYQKRKAH